MASNELGFFPNGIVTPLWLVDGPQVSVRSARLAVASPSLNVADIANVLPSRHATLFELDESWTEYEWALQFRKRSSGNGGPIRNRSGARPDEESNSIPVLQQGLGDTFQFIRYVELARRRVGRVVLEVQKPLLPLLSGLRGVDEVIAAGQAPPRFDFHLPLMSLPGAFGTQIETIPADVPYVFADPQRVQTWQARLENLTGFRVGIGWQGNPQYRGDRQRSIPLENFSRLAAVPGIRLISLQKGDGAAQIARNERPFPLTQFDDLDADGGAFMDTAAILKNVELVVTSDTALAHLAGSMGVEVWVALPYAADWRWFREREDSPWYPTMRLFRQNRRGDWKTEFDQIAIELAARSPDGAGRARRAGEGRPAVGGRPGRISTGNQAGQRRESWKRPSAPCVRPSLCTPTMPKRIIIWVSRWPERECMRTPSCRSAGRWKSIPNTVRRRPIWDWPISNRDRRSRRSPHCVKRSNPGASPDVYNHLGVALSRIGKTSEAVDAYRTALRLAPEFAAAHVNLARAFVALERYHEAWLELEWQWNSRAVSNRKLRKPRWAGEPLKGRTILVYAEDSPAETLPYLKYVIELSNLAGRVILACSPELLSKVSAAPGVYAAVPMGETLPDHDVYVPLLSLPWLLEKSS